ncbi:MAG: dienelactone hydrolase family protein [Acidimicrobiales bacterium]
MPGRTDVAVSTIELATPEGSMPLYTAAPAATAARPAGGKGGAVSGKAMIVIQEAFGVNSYIEDVTERLAGQDWYSVAPHLFHRSGGGALAYGHFELARPHIAAMSDEAILADLDATLDHLSAKGFATDRTCVIGFCLGGRASFLAASRRELGAAAGFYGGGIIKGRSRGLGPIAEDLSEMRTPWLGLFGDRDRSIPVEEVEELRRRLSKAPVPTEVIRYAGAGHGFHCDQRDSYNPEAAADAWRRALAWCERFIT